MNNIVLIGMPGAGKTTVATCLKDFLPNFSLLNIDELIEQDQQLKISVIFEKFGENYFRKLEEQKIAEAIKGKNKIIALGGGAFESKKTRALLQNSTSIYLKTSPSELFKRISAQTHRPLLEKNFELSSLENLLNKREKNYSVADIIIETDGKLPAQIADEIRRKL